MTPSNTPQTPNVARIRIDYVDGSFDLIEALPDTNTEIALYGWSRTTPDFINPYTAKTASAIAALLFKTALLRQLTKYDAADPKTRQLIREYASGFWPSKTKDV